jgi:hypothetical protein
MSVTDRCDEIIRLIDEVLGESSSETDVRRHPAPPNKTLQTAVGARRVWPALMPVEH